MSKYKRSASKCDGVINGALQVRRGCFKGPAYFELDLRLGIHSKVLSL